LDFSKKRGRPVYIISDDPYRNIVYDGLEAPSIFSMYPYTLIANSFSKDLSLPGERIGYALINPDCEGKNILFDAFTLCNRICGFVNAPAIMQRVIVELLAERIDVSVYEKRRNIIYDYLTGIGYKVHKPEGAFYLFVKSPIENDIEFVNKLLEENILVVPGAGFGRSGFFRLAYCVNEETIYGSFKGFKKTFVL